MIGQLIGPYRVEALLGVGAVRAILLIALALAPTAAPADPFVEAAPLQLEISAPFGAVFARAADPEYQPATLSYSLAGDDVAIPLRVRVRGKSRAVACTFPPLLLNFRTRDLAATLFEGEDRMKLVTHCRAGADYEQYLLLEHLGYRVLGLVTDMSLRTRLVSVSYTDDGRGRDLGAHPGILLEDEERFGERNGLVAYEGESVDRALYDADALALVDVFEYFMGNTDWSATAGPSGAACCHNVVPYMRADGRLVPVPYDFDSSGLVDAPHAEPDTRLPIRTVRQRLYRGRCRPLAELEPAFERFLTRRSEILGLFDESSGLNAKAAASARQYVEAFYATLDDPERREREFTRTCGR